METIDFVIPWVDGEDPQWKSERKKYEKAFLPTGFISDKEVSSNGANDDCRYRDYGFLRYWFRSVESFAPWVNRVYFITCGQRPDWLNIHHPKIVCLNHSDYIPEQYLPTFNSNTIELNLHRIDSLSERFVLFNDDVFLLQPVAPDFFFKDGKPVLMADLRYPGNVGYNNWSRVMFNDYCVLHRSFDMRKAIWDNRRKWFSITDLGLKRVRQNFLAFCANKSLPVHFYGHVSQAHLKSTLQEVWDRWPDVMDTTCSSRFRSDVQVNHWLLCAWNQAKGCFYPAHEKDRGQFFRVEAWNHEVIRDFILTESRPQICINDNPDNTDPERAQQVIEEAFSRIFPVKSEFELN